MIRKDHHTWINAAKLHISSNNYTLPQIAIAGDLRPWFVVSAVALGWKQKWRWRQVSFSCGARCHLVGCSLVELQ